MRHISLTLFFLSLSGCGIGVCLNQAECPDGSWSVAEDTHGFADFTASNLHRDKTSAQRTLKEELAFGAETLPSGYRKVPDINKDDDAGFGAAVTFGSRPSVVCGTTQASVDARVTDCAAANGATATWDGAAKGNAGQSQWKLVTYNGTHEVWRDERTGFIWSDRLGLANWCLATGSSGGGPYGQVDPMGYCDNVAYQPVQSTPESWCTEDTGFNTPSTYDSMKGGMRLLATATSPGVVWRLPTKWDLHQAEIDGIRFPLPNMSHFFWSASVVSNDRNLAWHFTGDVGYFLDVGRDSVAMSVRCVGR